MRALNHAWARVLCYIDTRPRNVSVSFIVLLLCIAERRMDMLLLLLLSTDAAHGATWLRAHAALLLSPLHSVALRRRAVKVCFSSLEPFWRTKRHSRPECVTCTEPGQEMIPALTKPDRKKSFRYFFFLLNSSSQLSINRPTSS